MEKILFHKYEVLRPIGAGGMGQVWLARDMHLNQPVVVKESREDFLFPETEILKELAHPGLPIIYDCFRQGEGAFLVMEYIKGMSLRQYMDKHGKVSEKQAQKWAMELCGILGYLHERRPAVVYRDLKPENIMIRQDGTLKLIDFGGARPQAYGDKKELLCVGTAGYSPPEQWQSACGNVTFDIYGLGAVLHEMLTGDNPARPAFRRRSVREYDRSLSGAWDTIIQKCTAKKAEDRYQSVGELEKELSGKSLFPGRIFPLFMPGKRLPVRLGQIMKRLLFFLMAGDTASSFIRPLLQGVPEREFPFPCLEKPLMLLIVTLLTYLLFFRLKKKKNFIRKREKNIFLSEKKFSGLVPVTFFVLGEIWISMFGLSLSAAQAAKEPESLWVEMRDDLGRKMLLKYDAVYETGAKVSFELPAKRLPEQKIALQIAAVGEDGTQYASRIFYVKRGESSQKPESPP